MQDKKLGYRREAARYFISLNISLSHSISLKVIVSGTIVVKKHRCDNKKNIKKHVLSDTENMKIIFEKNFPALDID